MQPPPVVRQQSPRVIRILGGLFGIRHVKQIISLGLSVCIFLSVVRALRFRTLVTVILIYCVLITLLSLIEHFLNKRREATEPVPLLVGDSLMDLPHDQASRVRYTLGAFRTLTARSADRKCLICEAPLFGSDQVALTECCHMFHQTCFEQWTSIEISCPAFHSSLLF
jgi:hypothetical protein